MYTSEEQDQGSISFSRHIVVLSVIIRQKYNNYKAKPPSSKKTKKNNNLINLLKMLPKLYCC